MEIPAWLAERDPDEAAAERTAELRERQLGLPGVGAAVMCGPGGSQGI